MCTLVQYIIIVITYTNICPQVASKHIYYPLIAVQMYYTRLIRHGHFKTDILRNLRIQTSLVLKNMNQCPRHREFH